MKICKCNKCNKFYEDTNPQITSVDFPDIDLGILSYARDIEDVDTIFVNGCPKCHTDSFLKDSFDFNDEDLKELNGINTQYVVNPFVSPNNKI